MVLQLASRYPELIVTLKEMMENEGSQHVDWVASQFDRIRQNIVKECTT